MMRVNCASCPYWDEPFEHCRRFPKSEPKHGTEWCGEHPDFGRINVQLVDVSTFDDEGPVLIRVGDDAA